MGTVLARVMEWEDRVGYVPFDRVSVVGLDMKLLISSFSPRIRICKPMTIFTDSTLFRHESSGSVS